MNTNIEVINRNGDKILAQLIAYIELQNSKKYLFYTLNEVVENNLIKIYIAQTFVDNNQITDISDDEWKDIRNKMVIMNKKEQMPDAKYVAIPGGPIIIGTPKKIGITSDTKQNFMDVYSLNVSSSSSNQGGSSFFYQEPIASDNNPNIVDNSQQLNQNIFANNSQQVNNNFVQNVPIIDNNMFTSPANEQIIDTSIAGLTSSVNQFNRLEPAVNQENASNLSINEGNLSNNMFDNSQNVIDPFSQTPIVEGNNSSVPTNQFVEQNNSIGTNVDNNIFQPNNTQELFNNNVDPISQSISSNESNVQSDKIKISDEEALKAIDLIQSFIAQENVEE